MRTFILTVVAVLLYGCSNLKSYEDSDAYKNRISKNSIYHWKSTFKPTQYEMDFLRSHNIGRLYMKMFDVSVGDVYSSSGTEQDIVPIATTVFSASVPSEIEVIPTVFITLEALRFMEGKEKVGAEKIITRCMAMADYNSLGKPKEIQIDCDWTSSTRNIFFLFCQEMKNILDKDGILLSCTIRLHQLKDKTFPPVDRGMLMLYNTGNFRDIDTRNSIICYDDIKPYINDVKGYGLPLDFAYPDFSWNVLYQDSLFDRLEKGFIDLADTATFERINSNTYRVKNSNNLLYENYTIRHEESKIEDILKVKQLVEKKLATKNYSSIIYHLDSVNLSKFTDNEINEIYKTNEKYENR